MDNAGGSVLPASVIARATAYMSRYQVQVGASYPRSREAGARIAAGRAAAAALVNAAPDEVVLGPSTTVNLQTLRRALAPGLAPGDEVIVTDLDHESNIGAWLPLRERGVVLRTWPFDRARHTLELDALEPLLGPRTRLVCFTHAANVVGYTHDVAAITRRVHAAGARVCVDGVAFAPHRRVDVKALGVDFYALSLYKVYGPHIGLLYGAREHLLAARGQNHFFIEESRVPYKFEAGSVNHELTASLVGVREYLAAVDRHHGGDSGDAASQLDRVFALFAAHERRLLAPLLAYLRARPDVRVIGPGPEGDERRVPTVAFTVRGRRASELVPLIDRARVAIRWGDFYARRAIDGMGLRAQDGVVRVSMVHYNTLAEVERLIAALDDAL